MPVFGAVVGEAVDSVIDTLIDETIDSAIDEVIDNAADHAVGELTFGGVEWVPGSGNNCVWERVDGVYTGKWSPY